MSSRVSLLEFLEPDLNAGGMGTGAPTLTTAPTVVPTHTTAPAPVASPEQNNDKEMEADGFVDPIEVIDTIRQDGSKIEATVDGDLKPEEGTDEENDEPSMNEVDTPTPSVDNTSPMVREASLPINQTNARNLALIVVANSNGAFRLARHSKGAYRLQLVNDKDKDKASQLIIQAMRGFKVKAINPGEPGASSGKYTTYILAKSKTQTVKVVFCAGKNQGQQFEKQLKNSIAARKGVYWELIMRSLKSYYGVRPINVKRIVKGTGGDANIKRPFTATMSDVGTLVSDMDIQLTKPFKLGDQTSNIIHVSIKNTKGSTFANTGYRDGFKLVRRGTGSVVTPVTSTNAAAEFFLAALGVDKAVMAKGLTDYNNYLSGKKVKSTHAYYITPTVNRKLLEKLLAAQMGYGYVYARQTKDGLKLLDFYKPEKVVAQVGTITGVVASYPFVDGAKKSKQLSVLIQTTTGKFIVEVRNASGGVTPTQLNIKFD